jgi:hypothetical protein
MLTLAKLHHEYFSSTSPLKPTRQLHEEYESIIQGQSACLLEACTDYGFRRFASKVVIHLL